MYIVRSHAKRDEPSDEEEDKPDHTKAGPSALDLLKAKAKGKKKRKTYASTSAKHTEQPPSLSPPQPPTSLSVTAQIQHDSFQDAPSDLTVEPTLLEKVSELNLADLGAMSESNSFDLDSAAAPANSLSAGTVQDIEELWGNGSHPPPDDASVTGSSPNEETPPGPSADPTITPDTHSHGSIIPAWDVEAAVILARELSPGVMLSDVSEGKSSAI